MNNALAQIRKIYDRFVRIASGVQSPLLLLIRIYWGWQISQNGWGKLHNLSHVTEFFASLGLPAPGPTAAFVSTFEFVGGILLGIGLLSRVTALGLVIDMTTAYITADREAFFSVFSAPEKFYNADPFIFFFAGLLILMFGPGKIAVDALLERYPKKGRVQVATRAAMV
jgi:putative oxidoreductase